MMKRIILTFAFVGLVWAPTFIHAQDTQTPQPAATQPTSGAAEKPAATETTDTPSNDAPADITAAQAELQPDGQPATGESEPPPTATELMNGAASVINDWRALGWVAGIIALLNLLMNLLKFGPVAEWFTVNKKKWMKPYIAAGLGSLLGGFSAYQTTVNVMQGVGAGLLAGLTAVGVHELAKRRKVTKRNA